MTFFAVAAEPYTLGIARRLPSCLAGKYGRLPVVKLVVLDNVDQIVLGQSAEESRWSGSNTAATGPLKLSRNRKWL